MSAKITVPDVVAVKRGPERGRGDGATGRRLTMVTAYDCTFARLVDRAGVDVILVGDSLGMVVQGEASTLPVTLEEMLYHVRLVARARPRALVLGDLPFLSYQTSRRDALESAGRLIKAGAEAVKLEGGRAQAATIRALVRADMPVMGHVGLTPQSVHRMGGHKVQGRDAESRQRVLEDARAVADAGAFAVVLEGIPLDLAREITEELPIPTIGIGAGRFCDGQVLVIHDLLGLSSEERPAPRFVRRYANLGALVTSAVAAFTTEVRSGGFPSDPESYHAPRPTDGAAPAAASVALAGPAAATAAENAPATGPGSGAAAPERSPERMVEIRRVAEMRAWADRQRALGLRIALVPTMGYLHDGHLALVREARRRGDRVVVSIFVNPIQFDREEDLVSYPRDPERDRRLLAGAGVDVIFAPDPREMYPEEFCTSVDVDRLTKNLCGAHRPGHFRGVTTVVAKLFHAVRPDVAVFGDKDYQQLAVVRRMACDLDFGVEVVGAAVVREADGLAMSSRNARLSAEGRRAARAVPAALDAARLALARGARASAEIVAALAARLAAEPRARLEYATVCDGASLEPIERIDGPARLAVAVWVDGVRLIDNVQLDPTAVAPERIAPDLDAPEADPAASAVAEESPQLPAAEDRIEDTSSPGPLWAEATKR